GTLSICLSSLTIASQPCSFLLFAAGANEFGARHCKTDYSHSRQAVPDGNRRDTRFLYVAQVLLGSHHPGYRVPPLLKPDTTVGVSGAGSQEPFPFSTNSSIAARG